MRRRYDAGGRSTFQGGGCWALQRAPPTCRSLGRQVARRLRPSATGHRGRWVRGTGRGTADAGCRPVQPNPPVPCRCCRRTIGAQGQRVLHRGSPESVLFHPQECIGPKGLGTKRCSSVLADSLPEDCVNPDRMFGACRVIMPMPFSEHGGS